MWKDIVGYEGIYEVNSIGEVRSLDRTETLPNGRTRFRKGRVLKQNNSHGYYYVELNKNGKCKKINVHRLVCEAFHVKTPGNNIVNHVNGNKLDNRFDNLEWSNHSYNTLHALQNGLITNVGENANEAKLSTAEVIEIRKDTVLSYEKLAIKYNVSKSTIADIKKNRSWKYIDVQTEYVEDIVDTKKFLDLLEVKRKELKLKFSEFSSLIGVSHSTLNRWKRGEIVPRRNTAFQVSKILDIDIKSFFQ